MPVVAQMRVELGIQRSLVSHLSQHLVKPFEAFRGLEDLGSLPYDGFQYFLVHLTYPYPVRVR